LYNPEYFLNRELSWIRFNARVLEEARDVWHPLLERIKFIAICGSNLDEFFMTRIPRLMKKVKSKPDEKSMDGRTAMEQIEATRKEIIPLIESHASCWKEELIPALGKQDIHIRNFSDLPDSTKENLREFFNKSILPLVKIPKEGFSNAAIENLHITLFVSGFTEKNWRYLIDVPTESFGRLIRIPSGYSPETEREMKYLEHNFVFL